jgi:hypothetical protein
MISTLNKKNLRLRGQERKYQHKYDQGERKKRRNVDGIAFHADTSHLDN